MRRGEIWWANFEPGLGAEANRARPAVVVSRDAGNEAAAELGVGVVTVVPLTSMVGRIYPFEVFCPATSSGLSRDSKAQVPQIRAVDVRRFSEMSGALDEATMAAIDQAIRLHLAL
ncbi:MAG: type II toxin-antitoxin system PemK/MazF family toxin [Bifidobacteriaceae bacterium]|jgi:mRNA interferase MazF|nr:type II toxin-antitoxin system PemK/MazF family toxin [Bifidobacteriaceae bacterium]